MHIKLRNLGFVLVALLLPLVLVGTVWAQEQPTEPTQSQTTESEVKEPLTADQKKAISDRIQQRKAEAKLKLTNAQQKRLQTRCKAGQGAVKKVSGRLNGIETSRTKVHTNLVDRLTSLQTKLAEKSLDTAALQAQITELKAKIATFQTDLATYKQLVSDLGNIEDCTADPTAFKASLEATRTALKKVHDDAVAIRSYVNDTIKPTIKTLRAQLETPTTTEAN